MKIVMLDTATLGSDMEFSVLKKYGEVTEYPQTTPENAAERTETADVVILNKVKANEESLKNAKSLKLICVTATGFDNVDLDYCRKNGIAVCNVKGYSTDSVAQLTAAMALSLVTHLPSFDKYVKDKSYTKSGLHNCLTPVFHEISGMTWGIVGMGEIGRKTAQIAGAFGARVIAYSRTVRNDAEYTDIEDLCRRSDIISLHVPLNAGTENLISRERIALMKKSAVLINAARGAVMDEKAAADAIIENKIGGLGVDVFSAEPMQSDSPYNQLLDRDNVILTPHMAWGAYEARRRCIEEIAENINAFFNTSERRNRVV